jgi:hypothetical protein
LTKALKLLHPLLLESYYSNQHLKLVILRLVLIPMHLILMPRNLMMRLVMMHLRLRRHLTLIILRNLNLNLKKRTSPMTQNY